MLGIVPDLDSGLRVANIPGIKAEGRGQTTDQGSPVIRAGQSGCRGKRGRRDGVQSEATNGCSRHEH